MRKKCNQALHVGALVCGYGLTGWQWAEQLMLLVRSRWKPLEGSRLRLHCRLWHRPLSSCSTSVWPGRSTPRSPNTHTASRTEHTHTHRSQCIRLWFLRFFHFVSCKHHSPHLYLLQAHWFCVSDRKARSSCAASPCRTKQEAGPECQREARAEFMFWSSSFLFRN